MPSPRRAAAALQIALIWALGTPATGPPHRVSAHQSQIASERPAGPTVDFVALDASGAPVADLQPSDVEIRLADRVRAVRTLRRVSAAPPPIAAGAPARVPPPYGTNDNVAAGRRFVLVIDQESFIAGREQLFRDAIEGLLESAHAGRSDDGRRTPVRWRDASLHVGHGTHPPGGGSRDGPGVTHRDRIRYGLPHSPIPRIARRAAPGSRPARIAADTGPLHCRSRRPPARRTDGSRAGHVRAGRRSVPPGRHRGQRRTRERLRHAAGRHRDTHVAAASDGRRRRRHRVRQPARRHRAPRRRHRRNPPVAGRDRDRIAAPRREGELGLLRRRSRARRRRSLRPQPPPERACRAARRHRPCTPRSRAHGHGARQDGATHRERHPRLDRGRDGSPVARRQLHRPRSGRQAARGRPGGAGWTRPSRSRRLAPS